MTPGTAPPPPLRRPRRASRPRALLRRVVGSPRRRVLQGRRLSGPLRRLPRPGRRALVLQRQRRRVAGRLGARLGGDSDDEVEDPDDETLPRGRAACSRVSLRFRPCSLMVFSCTCAWSSASSRTVRSMAARVRLTMLATAGRRQGGQAGAWAEKACAMMAAASAVMMVDAAHCDDADRRRRA